ncbi:hypothetical protein FPQ18DRAFT_377255 [Pyronema domesticum]|nr:hypothetical protein FPQ18DRAFT_377255 [Pyronema domesticum]
MLIPTIDHRPEPRVSESPREDGEDSNKYQLGEDYQYLIKRLGKANTKRRQLLRYHNEHHEKIVGRRVAVDDTASTDGELPTGSSGGVDVHWNPWGLMHQMHCHVFGGIPNQALWDVADPSMFPFGAHQVSPPRLGTPSVYITWLLIVVSNSVQTPENTDFKSS